MMDRNSRRKWHFSVVIVTTLVAGLAFCRCQVVEGITTLSSQSSPPSTSSRSTTSLPPRRRRHGQTTRMLQQTQLQPTHRLMDELVLEEQKRSFSSIATPVRTISRTLFKAVRGGARISIGEFVTELNVLKLSSYIMMSMGIVVKLCTDTMLEYLCGFTEDNITYGLRVFFSWSGSYMLAYGILVYKLLIEPPTTTTPSSDDTEEGSVIRRRNAIGSAMIPLLIEMLTGLINGNPSKLGYHPLVNYIWTLLYGVVMYSCFEQTSWCDICLKISSILMLCTSSILAFAPEIYLGFYGMTSYGVPPMLAESIFFVAKSNGYFGLMIGWLLLGLTFWNKLSNYVSETTHTIFILSWIPLVGYTIDGLWIGKQTKTLNLHCCTYMMGLVSQIVLIFLPTMARILAEQFEKEALKEEDVVS